MRNKAAWAVLLILMFFGGFAQLMMPDSVCQQTSGGNQAYWLSLATNAWKYFQPGVGLNGQTGLHSASLGWPYFTDWDLGVYIQATIDASQLGILGKTGTYGADWRFDKVLTFLENRQLDSNGVPYVWYETNTGNPHETIEQNACDAGKLLMALNNLRIYRTDLATRVNNIVNNRTNYTPLKLAVDALTNSAHIYNFYVANGFAGFWPSRFSSLANLLLNNIALGPTVSAYGVNLPKASISDEILLQSIFELNTNPQLQSLTSTVYQAHEARYAATGKYIAFSEGNTMLDSPTYVYEWVVRSDGLTWVIDDGSSNQAISPIIYFKAAVGLLAVYNTTFTRNMVSYVESKLPSPTLGYEDGIDENGRVVSTTIDKTNGLILEAAEYAINKSPNPSPTPTSTLTPTPTLIPTPTPTSTPTQTPSPTPKPTSAPTPTPPPSNSPTPTPTSTASPTPMLSPTPTQNDTSTSTPAPTGSPSPDPTASPTSSAGSSPVGPTSSLSQQKSASPSSVESSSPKTTSNESTNSIMEWRNGLAVLAVMITVGGAVFLFWFLKRNKTVGQAKIFEALDQIEYPSEFVGKNKVADHARVTFDNIDKIEG